MITATENLSEFQYDHREENFSMKAPTSSASSISGTPPTVGRAPAEAPPFGLVLPLLVFGATIFWVFTIACAQQESTVRLVEPDYFEKQNMEKQHTHEKHPTLFDGADENARALARWLGPHNCGAKGLDNVFLGTFSRRIGKNHTIPVRGLGARRHFQKNDFLFCIPRKCWMHIGNEKITKPPPQISTTMNPDMLEYFQRTKYFWQGEGKPQAPHRCGQNNYPLVFWVAEQIRMYVVVQINMLRVGSRAGTRGRLGLGLGREEFL